METTNAQRGCCLASRSASFLPFSLSFCFQMRSCSSFKLSLSALRRACHQIAGLPAAFSKEQKSKKILSNRESLAAQKCADACCSIIDEATAQKIAEVNANYIYLSFTAFESASSCLLLSTSACECSSDAMRRREKAAPVV